MSTETIKKRSEILFLYDVTEGNPNGDPDENKPRIDEETDRCLVTDVRLKRTVRDFLRDYRDEAIFVTRVDDEAVTSSRRLRECLDGVEPSENSNFEGIVMEKFIDLRLFGSTIAVQKADKSEITKKHKTFSKDSIVRTGPVQFRLGRTMHTVEPREIKGTSVFSSKEQNIQGTFRDDHSIPYGLIAFYGVVNENSARRTLLSEGDLLKLQDGLWNGTINLNTRSKGEHRPRLLLRIEYKEGNYHMGGLDSLIELIPKDEKDGRTLRKPKDYELDAAALLTKIWDRREKIERIVICEDDAIEYKAKDPKGSLKQQLEFLGDDKNRIKVEVFNPDDEQLRTKKKYTGGAE